MAQSGENLETNKKNHFIIQKEIVRLDQRFTGATVAYNDEFEAGVVHRLLIGESLKKIYNEAEYEQGDRKSQPYGGGGGGARDHHW